MQYICVYQKYFYSLITNIIQIMIGVATLCRYASFGATMTPLAIYFEYADACDYYRTEIIPKSLI